LHDRSLATRQAAAIGRIADALRVIAVSRRVAEFPQAVGRPADDRRQRVPQQSGGQNNSIWRSPMESMFDRAAEAVDTRLTKMRWALGLNGVLSIGVGVVILVWPGISLFALTILFGAYTLATGAVGLGSVLSGAGRGERAWLVLSSLLGIAVGLIVLVWPDISAVALLYVIGGYAVALGIIAIGGAFYLPIDGGDTALLILSGLVSILFGIVMFANPGDGALVVLALISAFALITGITELIVAIGGERVVKRSLGTLASQAKPQTSH
jgi:uncharacterized membrane protein HdeD (DUF308 family)